MKAQEIFDTYKDYIMPTYTKVPLIFVKGKGSYLWDVHGKKYLDFFPGWGVGNLGHCHPKVMSAVRDQVSKLIFIPNNYYHAPQAKLAREIVYLSFPGKVFFCNSGAEANEAAIKFSRKFGVSTPCFDPAQHPSKHPESVEGLNADGEHFDVAQCPSAKCPEPAEGHSRTISQGRYEIISFENSFHGRTLAALAATGQKKYREGFEPLPEGFKIVRFNDIEAVKSAINPNKTVAIMLELIQGEGGVNVASREFVLALRKICDEKKLLLIIDEVQTGIGRTGKLFCYQHYGVSPDIITLAKAIAGGLPMGVMLVKKEIADTLGPGMHASTFGGGPLIAKAALAALTAIQKEKLLDHTQQMGEYLFSKLSELKNNHSIIKEVRGLGLMAGVELNIEGKAVVEKCIEHGLLINCTHERVLRLMPALNITEKEIDKAINILDSVLRSGLETYC